MKMICPSCGLKGTADAELFNKKVRCPQCNEVFRITEGVVVDYPQDNQGWIKQSVGGDPLLDEEKGLSYAVTNASSAAGKEVETAALDRSTCSRCGFILSGPFVRMIEERPVCTVCAG